MVHVNFEHFCFFLKDTTWVDPHPVIVTIGYKRDSSKVLLYYIPIIPLLQGGGPPKINAQV